MKKIKVLVSPYNTETKNNYLGQDIFFINALNKYDPVSKIPSKLSYSERGDDDAVLLLNYEDYDGNNFKCDFTQGYSSIYETDESIATMYKQEVTVDDEQNITTLTKLKPVNAFINKFKFRDFNITNRRLYQYILYPIASKGLEEGYENSQIPESFNWDAWSITELHPVSGNKKIFTATADDVWLFSLNIETGEQTQNIVRNEQQTLGQFNKYSQGKMNYVSGNVSCLLGSEVIPASYVTKKNGSVTNKGGYIERRIFDTHPTSNECIDMLLAWRKLIYSSNPKLLKDRAGQSFIVTLSNATNKPMDYVVSQPNTISFDWVQIGTTDGLQIIDNSL